MGAPTKALQKLLVYSRGKDIIPKDFKLEILICFNSPITINQHPHSYHGKNPKIHLNYFKILQIFSV
jgi:hypothetical protein